MTSIRSNITITPLNSFKKAYKRWEDNFKDIQINILTREVLSVFEKLNFLNITNQRSLINYLDLQGYYYMQRGLPYLSEMELELLYQAKNNWMLNRGPIIASLDQIIAERYLTETPVHYIGAGREAITLNNNNVVFTAVDGSIGTIGVMHSSSNKYPFGWCWDTIISFPVKFRYLSPYKYDLACITLEATGIDIYVSEYKYGDFQDGLLIASYFARANSGHISCPTHSHPWCDSDSAYVHEPFEPFYKSYFFGDFNGDGKDEIGVYHTTGFLIYQKSPSCCHNELMWLTYYESITAEQNPKDTWCMRSPDSSIQEDGIRVGDFNGDGKDDLWCHNKATGQNKIRFNTYTGRAGFDLLFSWESPSFSLAGTEWCKGGQVKIGDFNGDGKADVQCYGADNSIDIQFSLGNGMFINRQGSDYGLVASGEKLQGWDNGFSSYTDLIATQSRLHVGDFNGDGASDMIHIDNSGNTKVLISSQAESFSTRSSSANGAITPNGLAVWCSSANKQTVLLVGDFDKDGRDDVVCMRYRPSTPDPEFQIFGFAYDLLLVSNLLPETFDAFRAVIEIIDFNLVEVILNTGQLKSSVRTITCNNRLRPDDQLICGSHALLNLKLVDSIIAPNSWLKDDQASITTISYKGSASIAYNLDAGTSVTQSLYIETLPVSALVRPTLIHKGKGLESSISMSVESGECVKTTEVTKYASGIPVAFTATAHFKAYSEDNVLNAVNLMSFAKQVVSTPMILNPLDDSEILFEVSGYLSVNLIADITRYAEDC